MYPAVQLKVGHRPYFQPMACRERSTSVYTHMNPVPSLRQAKLALYWLLFQTAALLYTKELHGYTLIFWPIRMFTFRHGRVCDLRQRVCVWQVCQHIRHVQMHLRQGIPIWQRGRPWVAILFMKLSVACSFNLAHRYCFHNLCVWQKWIVNVISQFLVYASKYLLRGQLLLRYDPPYSFKK